MRPKKLSRPMDMKLDINMFGEYWDIINLTLKLAITSTFILIGLCLPIAWWLAISKSKFAIFMDTIFSLPLFLPPTVLGLYLLILFSPEGPISFLHLTSFAFSFSGLVIGSLIYSFPFVLRPIQNSFIHFNKKFIDVATILGASKWDTFKNIILPLSFPGIIQASILGFAHTVGEFGVVLMIGGNIPGKTQVLSIAIYNAVENLEYEKAHKLSLSLLIISFLLLFFLHFLKLENKKNFL